MLVEHYNKILKNVLKRSGGHLTYKHAKEVSLAVPLLDEARRFCSKLFGTQQTVGHTSPSAEKDITTMIGRLLDETNAVCGEASAAHVTNAFDAVEGRTACGYCECPPTSHPRTVYLPFVDNIVENLQGRFPDNILLSAFNIFNPLEAEQDQQHRLELLCEHYRTEVEGPEEVESKYSVLSTLLKTSYNALSSDDLQLKQLIAAKDKLRPQNRGE
ncbi:hypothetical protein Bbelb_349750 [Branchiostoma belcheri]|nr:hypothetical protein Bbelb_349750 [Branchiostoma belcheri]